MEILFELPGGGGKVAGAAAVASGNALVAQATRTGDRYRVQVEESELYPAIEKLRGTNAKILSVTQVKPSLEEYFMQVVEADRKQAGRKRAKSEAHRGSGAEYFRGSGAGPGAVQPSVFCAGDDGGGGAGGIDFHRDRADRDRDAGIERHFYYRIADGGVYWSGAGFEGD